MNLPIKCCKFSFLLTFFSFVFLNCCKYKKNKIRIVDRHGNTAVTERRIPEFNQMVLTKIKQRDSDLAQIQNSQQGNSSSNGDLMKVLKSNQNVAPKTNIHNLQQKTLNIDNTENPLPLSPKDKLSANGSQASGNPFVELDSINFNESKNIEQGKNVLLTDQNVINKGLKKEKKFNYITTKQAGIKNTQNKNKIKKNNDNANVAEYRQKVAVTPPVLRKKLSSEWLKPEQIGIGYFLQAGVFNRENGVNTIYKKLSKHITAAIHKVYDEKRNIYKIMIGPFSNRSEADKVLSQLVSIAHYDVIIVKH